MTKMASRLKLCGDQLIPVTHSSAPESLSYVKFPLASNDPHWSPKHCNTDINEYGPVALMSVVMNEFERLVLAHLKDITSSRLEPLSLPTG